MPGKRPGGSDSDADRYDQVSRPLRKRVNRKPKPPPPAPQKATVKELANEESGAQLSTTEKEVMARIKKCLDKEKHPGTPESEVKSACLLASRLMAQYNVTQADVLAANKESDNIKHSGCSIVSIKSTQGQDRKVVRYGFAGGVATAMTIFFDCKSYSSTCLSSIEWKFYGIAPNTIAAAMAFEMAFNLILEWARPKKGRSVTYSYCMGVSSGLWRMAEKEKEEELERVKRQEAEIVKAREADERLQREKESGTPRDAHTTVEDASTNRLHDWESPEVSAAASASPLPKSSTVSDQKLDTDSTSASDSDLDSNDDETDDHLNGFASEDESDDDYDVFEPLSLWRNGMQLVQHRESADKIAEDWIKAQGIKFSGRERRSAPIRDEDSYAQGEEDSKKIDVRQRRIKDEAWQG